MIDAAPSHAVLQEFLDNSCLAWGLIACGIAQLSKLVIELIVHRRWRPAVLIAVSYTHLTLPTICSV